MRLDLNLLLVIEAVMLERNVTRAANSLSMSQPAVSNALRRARKLMQDQLFLRAPDGVQPTSRMLAIWPELHRSLATIRSSIAPQHFDPRTDPTGFRLSVTDSLAAEAVCGITLKLRETSPYARVAFAFHTNASSLDAIERGTLDCSVGMFPALPRDIHVRVLRTEHYMCVMRRGHLLARDMTLDQFASADHVLVTPSGMDLGVIDGWLGLQGRTRTIMAVVNHFADALRIVEESDLLTCVPNGFIDGHGQSLIKQHELEIRPLPFEAEKLSYKLIWHERLHNHPAHQWFRSLVSDFCGPPTVSPE
ncbi:MULTISPECIES: LysR family transcriptional regulator [Streptomyces]|uniref:LysR family transcriptional regulator n=1 Tax=Streptomyces TaxID=1883 RepID=UPI000A3B0FD2|nr:MULTISPECIES: LysR family transcriptional regulator [Streptomyces]MDX3583135.1 LysR family transcriptional regulator [Streptomyces europaeiscabiei]MDX3613828.1 LysR family transcriptional regulator [Streptomyces europaeiscabiei]MDX3633967.1 LysR family transcriptional regulator [Streptomyces europaeiscabiei]MDX3651430.1 LysR family transcriptional regulator [Streptomyces europaeiscabiei]WUD35340.1 LysR family transcriptional regulator [Streptomyces europaeiscabiei]